jgi:predicted DNA-binding transcriptional regulator AlpA
MSDLEQLLTDFDLERLTGRSRSRWQKDRLTGTGPRFVRVGRLVRYRRQDFEEWLEARARSSTSDRGEAA